MLYSFGAKDTGWQSKPVVPPAPPRPRVSSGPASPNDDAALITDLFWPAGGKMLTKHASRKACASNALEAQPF